MLFTGQYEHTIDAKQRLAIPASIRAKWRPEVDGAGFFAVPWKANNSIRLYPEREFERMAMEQARTLLPDEDDAEIDATFFGSAEQLEIDSAGRVRIPETMLRSVGLGTEVTLVGARNRLEIRDRAVWKASEPDRAAQLPGLIARTRRPG